MTLILDAAYPPVDVSDWIKTLQIAGASGCMAYCYDLHIPGNRWTPDYCHAIQGAGYGILPVYVWYAFPTIGHARDVMAAYGWSSGPVMGDIEAGSWPSTGYYQAWCDDLRAHGYTPVTYGTGSTLDIYRRYGDRAFLAAYIQRQLTPIPDLRGLSYDGWQYANSFQVNGVEVDASVTSIPLQSAPVPDPNPPGVRMIFDPAGKLHVPYVSGGHVWLATSGGMDDFFHARGDIQDLGGPSVGAVAGTEAGAWAGGVLQLRVQGTDGKLYGWYGNLAGALVGWLPMTYSGGGIAADIPPHGPAGPPGPPGTAGATGPAGPKGADAVFPATVTVTGGTLSLK